MAFLGVNIDHIATIREARKTNEPDPVWAAAQAELGGADCITVHLREDRRHIQDRDVRLLKETTAVKLNLEMACADEIVMIALDTHPDQVTLVPEKREEVTTEGGLDVIANRAIVGETIRRLSDDGIEVSLFLDPITEQIGLAHELGADAIELHTGQYALAVSPRDKEVELLKLAEAGVQIQGAGMVLHSGHGLTYRNVQPIAQLAGMQELNIGHSIVSRAVFVGFQKATQMMKQLISEA
jgi:pyridoxine 5-phosphate synthase